MKAWNTEELNAYADLVSLGKPDFIEIKVRLRIFLIIEYLKLNFLNNFRV